MRKKKILFLYRRYEENHFEVTNEDITNTFVNDTKTSIQLKNEMNVDNIAKTMSGLKNSRADKRKIILSIDFYTIFLLKKDTTLTLKYMTMIQISKREK